MRELLEAADWFLLPLGLCSFFGLLIIVERLIALRESLVLPGHIMEDLLDGRIGEDESRSSLAGRILAFRRSHEPDPDALKAYATLEVGRLERGLFILDIVVGVAPLIGLLGTVTGLVEVFQENFSAGEGTPAPEAFIQGVALALSTTMLGLVIAIPALAGSSYLNRRVDMLAAKVQVMVERLIELNRRDNDE